MSKIVRRSDKLLKGVREISDFLDVGDSVVYALIEMGMPVLKIDKAREKYWAITHEIEAWISAKSRERKTLSSPLS
jgi:hypothetical protein